WLKDIVVREGERGRGLGAALIRQGFVEFARRDVRRVGLKVDARNPTGAPRLYERLGFTTEGREQIWALSLCAAPRSSGCSAGCAGSCASPTCSASISRRRSRTTTLPKRGGSSRATRSPTNNVGTSSGCSTNGSATSPSSDGGRPGSPRRVLIRRARPHR